MLSCSGKFFFVFLSQSLGRGGGLKYFSRKYQSFHLFLHIIKRGGGVALKTFIPSGQSNNDPLYKELRNQLSIKINYKNLSLII